MSSEVPMSALEEAEFNLHCTRLDYLLQERRKRQSFSAELERLAEQADRPMFLRRQAE
jgi:hypothetical protein